MDFLRNAVLSRDIEVQRMRKVTTKVCIQEDEASFGLFFSSWRIHDVARKTGKRNAIIINFHGKYEWKYQLQQ